jgi:hypothetical protein
MRRTSVFSSIAFLAGLAVGLFARGATGPLHPHTHAADLAAIEKLHKADVDSTRTQDPAALNLLWSDNAVKLDVPGSPVVGLTALQNEWKQLAETSSSFSQATRFSG